MALRWRRVLFGILVVLLLVAVAVQRLGPPRGAGAPGAGSGATDGPTATDTPGVARVEIAEEGTLLVGFAEDGTQTFEFGIEEWRAFAERHLDERLEEEVRIGEQAMPPSTFDRFGAAAPSPDGGRVLFTATAYALLTTVSVVTQLEVADGDLEVVPEVAHGGAEELTWSPDARFVAFAVATARAAGEGLRIVDVEALRTLVVLAAEDVLAAAEEAGVAVTIEAREFEPGFRELSWQVDGQVLHVTTADPSQADEAGTVRWSVDPVDGTLAPLAH